jgi:ketosteroid isomerase-like protein
MSREEIERLDDQGMAAWDGHDAQAFADLFADEFVVNDVAVPEPITTKDGVLGGLQNAVQPADHDEGEDHLAVVGLLVGSSK